MKPNEITQRDIEKWLRLSLLKAVDCDEFAPGADEQGDPMMGALAIRSRLADLGEQSSALAHELRQPLFTIAIANENLRLLLARSAASDAKLEQAVARIAQQVERAQTIIERTLRYASGHGQGQGLGATRADIQVALANAAEFLAPLFQAADIAVGQGRVDAETQVALCQVEAEQVFVNVLRNAAESIAARREGGWRGAGCIDTALRVRDGLVTCTITDNGAGLAAGPSGAVFQPFYTTKPRTGTGLGLHICRQVLDKLGGTISLRPGKSQGAQVVITLPLCG